MRLLCSVYRGGRAKRISPSISPFPTVIAFTVQWFRIFLIFVYFPHLPFHPFFQTTSCSRLVPFLQVPSFSHQLPSLPACVLLMLLLAFSSFALFVPTASANANRPSTFFLPTLHLSSSKFVNINKFLQHSCCNFNAPVYSKGIPKTSTCPTYIIISIYQKPAQSFKFKQRTWELTFSSNDN